MELNKFTFPPGEAPVNRGGKVVVVLGNMRGRTHGGAGRANEPRSCLPVCDGNIRQRELVYLSGVKSHLCFSQFSNVLTSNYMITGNIKLERERTYCI